MCYVEMKPREQRSVLDMCEPHLRADEAETIGVCMCPFRHM